MHGLKMHFFWDTLYNKSLVHGITDCLFSVHFQSFMEGKPNIKHGSRHSFVKACTHSTWKSETCCLHQAELNAWTPFSNIQIMSWCLGHWLQSLQTSRTIFVITSVWVFCSQIVSHSVRHLLKWRNYCLACLHQTSRCCCCCCWYDTQTDETNQDHSWCLKALYSVRKASWHDLNIGKWSSSIQLCLVKTACFRFSSRGSTSLNKTVSAAVLYVGIPLWFVCQILHLLMTFRNWRDKRSLPNVK